MITSKFICTHCDKAFKRRDHWVHHVRTHDDAYVKSHLTCDCDRTFSSVTAIKRHRRNVCPLTVNKARKVNAEPLTKEVETQTDFVYCANCMRNQNYNTQEQQFLE